jgi:hypothetical protein
MDPPGWLGRFHSRNRLSILAALSAGNWADEIPQKRKARRKNGL